MYLRLELISLLAFLKVIFSIAPQNQWFVIVGSELGCDRFHRNLNLLPSVLKFSAKKEQNNSLDFLNVSVEKEALDSFRRNSISPEEKIGLIKTLFQ